MTSLNALAVGAAAPAASGFNPLQLFLDADIVVQIVMIGLILAAIWVWAIIVGFSLKMGGVRRKCRAYEREFWKISNYAAIRDDRRRADVPSARVALSGVDEWQRSVSARSYDLEGARQRIAMAMESTVGEETNRLSNRLNFLATVGSVAPFVGLFGTVWGIMNSFFQIGAQESSSLAVVAPGISEALFATAIGLFAAIPAVIAYNRFGHRVDRYEARLQRFADKLNATFSRQLETR